jgi:hypothetical protein
MPLANHAGSATDRVLTTQFSATNSGAGSASTSM